MVLRHVGRPTPDSADQTKAFRLLERAHAGWLTLLDLSLRSVAHFIRIQAIANSVILSPARGTGCGVYISDMKLRVAGGRDHGPRKVVLWNALQRLRKPRYAFGLAEIAASEKNKPRRSGARLRKQPGVIEICGDDDPRFRSRVLDDLIANPLRRACQTPLAKTECAAPALTPG